MFIEVETIAPQGSLSFLLVRWHDDLREGEQFAADSPHP